MSFGSRDKSKSGSSLNTVAWRLSPLTTVAGFGGYEELPDPFISTCPAEFPELPLRGDECESLLAPGLVDLIRRGIGGDQSRDQNAGVENDPHRLPLRADGLFDRFQDFLLRTRPVALLDVFHGKFE